VSTEEHRAPLTRLAYQMLGSVAQAEEVVQEALLRLSRAQEPIAAPRAWLKTVATRLCLDILKSAPARREVYVGPWLPEPLVEDEPRVGWEVSVALMLALERLSPLERVAFLLHDVFDADFSEVATVLGRSEPACRQLAARARRHVQQARPRFSVSAGDAERLVSAFRSAAETGDRQALTDLLSADAVLYSDGGGVRTAALRVISSSDHVARFIAGIVRKGWSMPHTARMAWINGLPGLLFETPDGTETCAFDIEGGRITGVFIVRNPDKLHHLR